MTLMTPDAIQARHPMLAHNLISQQKQPTCLLVFIRVNG
jgi:hypothetical protein